MHRFMGSPRFNELAAQVLNPQAHHRFLLRMFVKAPHKGPGHKNDDAKLQVEHGPEELQWLIRGHREKSSLVHCWFTTL